MENKEIKGIKGYLILYIFFNLIYIFLTCFYILLIILLMVFVNITTVLADISVVEQIKNEFVSFLPMLIPLILNVLFIIFLVYGVILIFRKKKKAIKWNVFTMSFGIVSYLSLIGIISILFVISSLLKNKAVLIGAEIIPLLELWLFFILFIVPMVIWRKYLLKSKRVENTLIKS